MIAVVFERNRLGGGEGGRDHQLGDHYSLWGMNLMVRIKCSW